MAVISSHVQSHLIVSAAACVKLLSRIAYPVDEHSLHKAVDILVFIGNLKLSALHIRKNSFDSGKDGVSLLLCQNSLLCQHFHMGHASPHVLLVKFFIK